MSKTLSDVWNNVAELCRVNAEHRSGVKMGEVYLSTIFGHLKDEVSELHDVLLNDHENERAMKEEACDILGVLIHLLQKLDMTEAEVEKRIAAKFSLRFKS